MLLAALAFAAALLAATAFGEGYSLLQCRYGTSCSEVLDDYFIAGPGAAYVILGCGAAFVGLVALVAALAAIALTIRHTTSAQVLLRWTLVAVALSAIAWLGARFTVFQDSSHPEGAVRPAVTLLLPHARL